MRLPNTAQILAVDEQSNEPELALGEQLPQRGSVDPRSSVDADCIIARAYVERKSGDAAELDGRPALYDPCPDRHPACRN